jgi:hypothetical protein
MATTLPEGVKSETVTWHKADGTPTTNKDEAVTAEMVVVYDDGRTEHTLLRRKGSKVVGDV